MSFLSVVGKFVSEFARLILFIVSMVVLLSSLLLLAIAFQCRDNFAHIDLGQVNTIFTISVCFSVYLIVLSAIGLFASFFTHRNSIMLLAVLMALNVIISIGVLVSASSKVDSLDVDLALKLKSYQSKYDWNHANTSDASTKLATSAIDAIQTDLMCCGVHTPDDWRPLRPSGHEQENILPASCCADQSGTTAGYYCQADKSPIYQDGCLTNMERALAGLTFVAFMMFVFCFVISVLASLVLCCNPARQQTYYENYGR